MWVLASYTGITKVQLELKMLSREQEWCFVGGGSIWKVGRPHENLVVATILMVRQVYERSEWQNLGLSITMGVDRHMQGAIRQLHAVWTHI